MLCVVSVSVGAVIWAQSGRIEVSVGGPFSATASKKNSSSTISALFGTWVVAIAAE
jgi:hypothetical protein